ncbi:MAG TPA: SPOR domain-containing protein [Burkholderiales bacterium]
MARAGRTPQATQRKSGGGFLLGVFIGLLLGLAVALGVAFYLNKTPIPFLTGSTPAGKTATPAAGTPGAADARPPTIAGMSQGGRPVPPPGTEEGAEKPKYDFYRILPGGEEPVTDRDLKERMRATRTEPDAPRDVYYVQAGSFQNPADADNQKARLAILGLESSVEPTSLPDKGTWYRVRLGPYTQLEELNKARQTLATNGIDASLIKLKSTGGAAAGAPVGKPPSAKPPADKSG